MCGDATNLYLRADQSNEKRWRRFRGLSRDWPSRPKSHIFVRPTGHCRTHAMTSPDDLKSRKPRVRKRCHSIPAVADTIEVSPSSVRRLIRDGVLETIYIGASVRVTDESLERLIQAGTRRSSRRGNK